MRRNECASCGQRLSSDDLTDIVVTVGTVISGELAAVTAHRRGQRAPWRQARFCDSCLDMIEATLARLGFAE